MQPGVVGLNTALWAEDGKPAVYSLPDDAMASVSHSRSNSSTSLPPARAAGSRSHDRNSSIVRRLTPVARGNDG